MTRRLLVSYLAITVLVLAVLVLPLGLTYASREAVVLLGDIERDTIAVASLVEDDLENGAAPHIDDLLTAYASTGGRIVVVNTAGTAVADSQHLEGTREYFGNRPEIRQALAGQRAEGIRASETLGQNLMYVALPVTSGGRVHGVVRTTYPTAALDARVRTNWLRLAGLSAAVLAVVAIVGFLLARGVTRPVRDLQDVARSLSRGQLDARVTIHGGPPELRALAATVNTMADRLQRVLESQRLFVADAAHQLRTPMTALRLRLETLERHLTAGQRSKLDAAIAETVRLGRMVDSLLVLARADAQTGAPEPVDAAEIVNGRLEVWDAVATERGVRLVVDAVPCPPVLVMLGSLEQILDNLLSNAISASPPGSQVTIHIRPQPPHEVQVCVTDEGEGLDEQDRQRAFERFWRAPDARPGGGFGLGLAIARRLAEAAGGSIALAPAPGSGLQAVVRFHAQPNTTPSPASTATGTASGTGSLTSG